MLDELRDPSGQSPFLQEEKAPKPEQPKAKPPKRRASSDYNPGFLGMTAPQRFVLALMLFLMVLTAGAFCLIATGSVALPFF